MNKKIMISVINNRLFPHQKENQKLLPMRMLTGLKLFLFFVILFSASNDLQAQKLKFQNGGKGLLKFEVDGPSDDFQEITFDVQLKTGELKKGSIATFSLSAKIPPGFHLYTQKKTNIAPTVIKLIESPGLVPIESVFKPDQKPRSTYDKFMKTTYEDYEGTITWTRRFKIEDPKNASLKGTITGQYCSSGDNGRCIPIRPAYEFSPKLKLASADSESTGTVQKETPKPSRKVPYTNKLRPTRSLGDKKKEDPLELTFRLNPENAKPGETVTLSIHAKFDGKWHTYGLNQNPEYYAKPTKIIVDGIQGLKSVSGSGFQPDHAPEKHKPFEDEEAIQLVHHDEVTWSRKYEVLPEGKDGNYGISGSISYQVCKKSCLPYKEVRFELGEVSNLVPVTTPDGLGSIGILSSIDVGDDGEEDSRSLLSYIIFAFLGGVILNVMPCVLPVLAIKVMSFVQQAGESRSRIFMLNLTYAAGVVFVFLILASLAAFSSYGWGELFQDTRFTLIMACLVFAMGLSLLGVFEIPIPGVIGSAAGENQKEGLPGAFLTGIFATLLATPCSGPFLGTILGWSVKQPVGVIYLIWGTIGLGMATPYVIFGLFPNAIKLLPKPGMWMVRFKEFCGFVLMGTLIFIMHSVNHEYTMTLLILLLGIAMALWMIGNLYDSASPSSHKDLVRFSALVLFLGISSFAFYIRTNSNELEWKEFTETRLEKLIQEEKTVLIDFTADWCTNCKVNERFALNTQQTKAFLEKHDIVPLYADYTHESEEIKRWLDKFKSISVPLTVIVPAKNHQKTVILRDLYSQAQLIQKLNKAVELSENAANQSGDSQATASKTKKTTQR